MDRLSALIDPASAVRVGIRIGPNGYALNERAIEAEDKILSTFTVFVIVAVLATGGTSVMMNEESSRIKIRSLSPIDESLRKESIRKRQRSIAISTVGWVGAITTASIAVRALVRSVRRRQWRAELESVRASLAHPISTEVINSRNVAESADSSCLYTMMKGAF